MRRILNVVALIITLVLIVFSFEKAKSVGVLLPLLMYSVMLVVVVITSYVGYAWQALLFFLLPLLMIMDNSSDKLDILMTLLLVMPTVSIGCLFCIGADGKKEGDKS